MLHSFVLPVSFDVKVPHNFASPVDALLPFLELRVAGQDFPLVVEIDPSLLAFRIV